MIDFKKRRGFKISPFKNCLKDYTEIYVGK